jgi:uncharacterized protein (DUF2141 family)
MFSTVLPGVMLLVASSAVSAADISVDLQGCHPNKPVMLALYDSAIGFPDGKKAPPVRVLSVMAEKSSALAIFSEVKPGRYALAVYADLNNNKTLDLSFIGMPTEPYGFSRNARNVLSPPSFEQAAFDVTEAGTQFQIHLK